MTRSLTRIRCRALSRNDSPWGLSKRTLRGLMSAFFIVPLRELALSLLLLVWRQAVWVAPGFSASLYMPHLRHSLCHRLLSWFYTYFVPTELAVCVSPFRETPKGGDSQISRFRSMVVDWGGARLGVPASRGPLPRTSESR